MYARRAQKGTLATVPLEIEFKSDARAARKSTAPPAEEAGSESPTSKSRNDNNENKNKKPKSPSAKEASGVPRGVVHARSAPRPKPPPKATFGGATLRSEDTQQALVAAFEGGRGQCFRSH